MYVVYVTIGIGVSGVFSKDIYFGFDHNVHIAAIFIVYFEMIL